MEPLTVSVSISRPREEVFAYLVDIANHPEFTDHYLVDWHMTRVETVGRGAGGRFRYTAPLQRFDWADVTFVEVDAPRRIVQAGRGGKYNRTRLRSIYELEQSAGGTTRVTLTVETRPATPTDRFMESLGLRGWLKRKSAKALRRLRSILEDGQDRGSRATIAGIG
jgi:uncharacterized protein YndB with AHSA1/START domain